MIKQYTIFYNFITIKIKYPRKFSLKSCKNSPSACSGLHSGGQNSLSQPSLIVDKLDPVDLSLHNWPGGFKWQKVTRCTLSNTKKIIKQKSNRQTV